MFFCVKWNIYSTLYMIGNHITNMGWISLCPPPPSLTAHLNPGDQDEKWHDNIFMTMFSPWKCWNKNWWWWKAEVGNCCYIRHASHHLCTSWMCVLQHSKHYTMNKSQVWYWHTCIPSFWQAFTLLFPYFTLLLLFKNTTSLTYFQIQILECT